MDSKEIKPFTLITNQPYIFIGKTDAEVEVPVIWPPGEKSPEGKVSDAGQIEGRRRRSDRG